jgi:hypothetical protein
MDLEAQYKEESGYDVGKIHDIGVVYYSDDYVKWLEDKININKEGCKCGSNEYYAEVYKDVTRYYCKDCHVRLM